jgi:hypothetical protein
VAPGTYTAVMTLDAGALAGKLEGKETITIQ